MNGACDTARKLRVSIGENLPELGGPHAPGHHDLVIGVVGTGQIGRFSHELPRPIQDAFHVFSPFRALMSQDKARLAANPVQSEAARDGERCVGQIFDSNRRFYAFEQVAKNAQSDPKSIAAASNALKSLTDFDRSRGRYHDDGALIATVQGAQN